MPNILIRDLDPTVLKNIRLAAKQSGLSVNRLVVDTLTEKFSGLTLSVFHDLDALSGTWSAKDLAEFQAGVAPFKKVDRRLWPSKGKREK